MRPPERPGPAGFSLVELMVALVFTSLLLAGTAAVFKSSLGNYVAGAEKVSSDRQNLAALSLLFDDLNQAGMTPSSLTVAPPGVTAANPAFCVIPNLAYAQTDSPTPVTDQLILYFDRFLPYQMVAGAQMQGTGQWVQSGATPTNTLAINFVNGEGALAASDFTTAQAAGMGMDVLFQSNGNCYPVQSLASSGQLTFSSQNPLGILTSGAAVPQGSTLNLIVPGNYLSYSIQPRLLDPRNPTTYTPCLVRSLIAYPANASTPANWASPVTSTIIADNVTAFHVGLSADGGKTWAGLDPATGTWSTASSAWSDLTGPATGAASPTLNYQLANLNPAAMPAASVAAGGTFWFRQYPVLVRVDLTTRTLNKRTEFAQGPTANYKYQTRSIVLNPRHFGLRY